MRHADEADVLDVVGQVGPRPREAHIGGEGARHRKDAAPHVLGQIVADDHLGAHDAMGLGVAAALESARPVGPPHVVAKARDDRVQAVLLVDRDPLLGEAQALVRAAPVDQELEERGQRLAEDAIEAPAEERLEPALEVQPDLEPAMQSQQHRVPEAERGRRPGGHRDRPGRGGACDVAQRPQPRQEEIAAAAHGHELRQTGDPPRRAIRAGHGEHVGDGFARPRRAVAQQRVALVGQARELGASRSRRSARTRTAARCCRRGR